MAVVAFTKLRRRLVETRTRRIGFPRACSSKIFFSKRSLRKTRRRGVFKGSDFGTEDFAAEKGPNCETSSSVRGDACPVK